MVACTLQINSMKGCTNAVVVGFTFLDEQVPTGFKPHWEDWLGESTQPVEDLAERAFPSAFLSPERYVLWTC